MPIVTVGDGPIKKIPDLPKEIVKDIQEAQETLRPEDEAEATSGPKEALP